jgi:hypothetical protein
MTENPYTFGVDEESRRALRRFKATLGDDKLVVITKVFLTGPEVVGVLAAATERGRADRGTPTSFHATLSVVGE